MIDVSILDTLAVAIPSLAATFMTAKGIASVFANNFNTQKWGKLGELIDWLASNNKKAKYTGDVLVDSFVKDAITKVPPKTKLGKFLGFIKAIS